MIPNDFIMCDPAKTKDIDLYNHYLNFFKSLKPVGKTKLFAELFYPEANISQRGTSLKTIFNDHFVSRPTIYIAELKNIEEEISKVNGTKISSRIYNLDTSKETCFSPTSLFSLNNGGYNFIDYSLSELTLPMYFGPLRVSFRMELGVLNIKFYISRSYEKLIEKKIQALLGIVIKKVIKAIPSNSSNYLPINISTSIKFEDKRLELYKHIYFPVLPNYISEEGGYAFSKLMKWRTLIVRRV